MTTKATPTPSDVRLSTTTTPTSNTPISRILYLRSNRADQSYGPSHKMWIISPIYTRGKYHNLVLRSMNILHVFPNVRQTVLLNTGTKTVTIPAGNYDPCQIARYINDQLYPDVQTVCWDSQMYIFRFCPSINITADSTAAPLLGFRAGVDYTGATESVLPAQLWGPQRIVVKTNLQLFNIPISGVLAHIPVKEKYGQMVQWTNFGATTQHLCMDQHLQNIEVELTDEDGNPLDGYDEIPWDMTISFEPIDNPGFQNFIAEAVVGE